MDNKRMFIIAGFVSVVLLFILSDLPSASEGPEVIELDYIGDIYGPVIFDHAMHMETASCATCHHHTAGMPAEDEKCVQCHTDTCTSCEVACIDCHSAYPEYTGKDKEAQQSNLYHSDTAGLKRAYHVVCVGCHQEMDAVIGCEDCHSREESLYKN
jgi:hypothetical protein